MGMCFFKVGFLVVNYLVPIFAVNYDASMEGFSLDFLPDCTGVTEPVSIEPESLKSIFILVMDPDSISKATWTRYDYYHAADIAKNPGFDLEKKTFMFVPGYVEFLAAFLGWSMAEIYKKLGYNVLILETKEFTAMGYPTAARYTRRIGFHVAEMLANLTSVGLDPKKLELVGLSLGGHTMSFIAKNYRQLTGRNISLLVGLDPAGPCFRHLGPEL
ncbi:pancreatic lipase-related protein 2-like isoform X2 [Choristoneura fumiferana]|uniref:pancreatic lipase-related protein 2-like isoform X2 n=1 Tax=Choristoneura fumiferana TaxID=7141 RepID=UPI003D158567